VNSTPAGLSASVPYVNAQREVKRGTLVSELTLAGDVTAAPKTHVAFFIGDHPCNKDGSEIGQIKHGSGNQDLGDGLVVNHSFSNKPKDGYPDYYAKMTRYIEVISHPARADIERLRDMAETRRRPDQHSAGPFHRRCAMLDPRTLTHAQLAEIVADVQAILWKESRIRLQQPRQNLLLSSAKSAGQSLPARNPRACSFSSHAHPTSSGDRTGGE
jgi:hypothetical protein